jgi:hypothetical protein
VEEVSKTDSQDLVEEGYTTSYKYKEVGVNNNATTSKEEPQDVAGYTVQGTINTDTNQVTLTNTRKITVDTGINLTMLPYALITLCAICGGILFISRKRRVDR